MVRPPNLGRLRLSSIDDCPMVMEMLNESMVLNFRINCPADVLYLIENSVLSICQLDINDKIVGCLCVREYPLTPSVHPQAWEDYIWSKYKVVELNARNTLFIHLMCWNSAYGRDVVDSLLKSVFMHDPYIQHIAIVKFLIQYPLLVPGQSRPEGSFRRVQTMEKGVSCDQLPYLGIADRIEVSPKLRIRRAVEEDNDDIVPIIERHSKRLREIYGEFYISELISRHPESERVLLVCESKELAVGVMCLNTQINFEALEESFELAPFAGLRRLTEPFKRKKEVDSSPSFTGSHLYVPDEVNVPESISRSKEGKTRVTWIFEEDEFKSIQTESKSRLPVPPALSTFPPNAQQDILDMFEDEDELEFDIINIDTDLLRVPKLLSYDSLSGPAPAESIMKMMDNKRSTSNDKNKKETLKSPSSAYKPPEPIRYIGLSNAFLLELFAMHEDYDERYGFDMLEAAYELFPNRDYCIICLPSNHASFPLLEHFTLVTAYGSRMKFINETLYVAHVNSVRGDVKVRSGEANDMGALFNIMEHAPRFQALSDLFESTFASYTLEGFVLLSEHQPVGLVVVGPLESGTAIRTQFDLEPEPRRPGTDATILAGIVSPVMEPHSRWFLREIIRQSRYSTLFWMCRLFAKGDAHPGRNLMSLAGHMTPVRPRSTVLNISGNKDLDKMFKDMCTPFALWVVERPLTSLPKVYVNNSIVVVGSSRTGLAFLETLLLGDYRTPAKNFGPRPTKKSLSLDTIFDNIFNDLPTSQYLTFSNVTLVSEHGLPTVAECLRAADTCVPRNGRYTDRYIKSVPFYFYLDVMSAVMTGIDRKKKCIYLKSGGCKYYDELVLTCGQQFQHPEYLRDPLELVKEVERGKPCDRMLMDNAQYQPDKVPLPPDMPENVMVINSLSQANIWLRKLLVMISDYKDCACHSCLSEENPVVVYGECIEAYSCVAALLELGLSPNMIAFVEPFPPEDRTKLRVNCFNNETVDEKVQENLEKVGIRVYRKFHLASWSQRENFVYGLNLMSLLQATYLPCFALFYYGLKAIDIYAFKAINESGLVYDGGLVVGSTFETNDPHVYGAGTCVKYSRRLYANSRAHRYYCSEDVGEALARLFLRKLDPFVMGENESDPCDLIPRFSSSLLALKGGSHASITSATRLSLSISRARWQPVMKFESPIIQSATLPGPLYYMNLRKPGMEIPMEVQMCLPHQGHTLLTDKEGNYFRLQLNALHCVAAVTCLSNKAFSTEVFSQLYGKHEAFFDKLLTRFQKKLIDDLYDFFTQPWMAALYQETFENLLRDVNEHDIGTVYDVAKSRYSILQSEQKSKVISQTQSKCSDVPSCGYDHQEARGLGTFRSVIDRFVGKRSSNLIAKSSRAADIPTECGQSKAIRSEVASFWNTIDGERIVISHLAKYLNRNSVTNPHYAPTNPELT